MKISRDWATPVTMGVFAIMSVTGILMFFHASTGLNKFAHEWLGWLMIAGVLAHAAANWPGFKRYFLSSTIGRTILAASAVTLALTFVSVPGGKREPQPQAMAMKAVAHAPIASVAALTGKPLAQILADLKQAGIALSGGDASIESAIGENRELQAKAMSVLFAKS
ncbi:MAG: DUF4405 domain-containing protein [Hyphomicrobium sp.]|nr:DUF4405 domain-containing protein [Hyphomicrobium sp.]